MRFSGAGASRSFERLYEFAKTRFRPLQTTPGLFCFLRGIVSVMTRLAPVRRATRADRVATLEDAKAQFQKSWDAWKAWAKLEEVP